MRERLAVGFVEAHLHRADRVARAAVHDRHLQDRLASGAIASQAPIASNIWRDPGAMALARSRPSPSPRRGSTTSTLAPPSERVFQASGERKPCDAASGDHDIEYAWRRDLFLARHAALSDRRGPRATGLTRQVSRAGCPATRRSAVNVRRRPPKLANGL